MKKRIDRFLKRLFIILQKPQMRVLPGNLAFFFVLSIVPIVTLLVLFGSLLNVPVDKLLETFNNNLPKGIGNFLVPAFTDNTMSISTILILILTFYIASNGAKSIIITSNTLYDIKSSNTLKQRLKSILIIILIIILILFMFIIPIFGEHILRVLLSFVNNQNIYNSIFTIYYILQIPLSLIFIYFNIKLIYTISPDKKIKSSDVTYGAIFTTIIWVIVTQIYSFYVGSFANYSKVYGNLSNIIVLMLFVYLLTYVFVVGMALNASKEELEEKLDKTDKIKIREFVQNNKYTK